MSKPSSPSSISAIDAGLYAIVVAAWGLSWFAMRLQAGHVDIEASVVWRFVVAGTLVLLWARLAGQRLVFSLREQALLALLGVLNFGINSLTLYGATRYLPSGLIGVFFSMASICNAILAALLFRTALEPRFLVAGAVGVGGVALLFLPGFRQLGFGGDSLIGLALAIGGMLSFSLGSVVFLDYQRRGMPVLSTLGYAMFWGAAFVSLYGLVRGRSFAVSTDIAWVGSFIYITLVVSVIGWAAYYTMIRRIGAARGGYTTILAPLLALGVSAAFEGWRPDGFAIAGIVLVIAGNLMAMTQGGLPRLGRGRISPAPSD